VLNVCRELGYELVIHPCGETDTLCSEVVGSIKRSKLDGVIVLRPRRAWVALSHPLDIEVEPVRLEEAIAQQALALACAVLGASDSPQMPERRRFSFTFPGGRLIDSSPMYGSSQPTIGYGLKKLGYPQALFSAEKVWISNPTSGPPQIERSRTLWGVPRFDLLQVHNLLSWERHLPALLDMKSSGKVRYVGITTSEGRRHSDIERIMAQQPIDFVQFTYNVVDREAERRLLPLARERGIAVLINRPFRQGDLIRYFYRRPLPKWVSETGASSWAQFLLKFVISHPAVICVIPATSRVDHLRENMAAAAGVLPAEAMRVRMAEYARQF
jgi:diketogulonate reductase-like aldo/keto reductase